MSDFVLDPALPPAAALRAAALAELDRALAALRRGDARGVHEMRKSGKRLRAWTRLLRDLPLPGSLGLRRTNRLLRNAGQALAASRDAAVAQQTAATLQRPSGATAQAWRQLQSELKRQAEGLQQPDEKAVAAARRALASARKLIAALPVSGLGPAELRHGLRRSYKRARKAWHRAEPDDAESLHEWRKRAKRLEALQALLGEAVVPTKALATLNDLLGQHHDLHVLPLRPQLSLAQRKLLQRATAAPRLELEKQLQQCGKTLFD